MDPSTKPTTYWHPLVNQNSPSWASEWGEDTWGVFASFRVGDVLQKMRWVPAGTFWMGSPENEAGRDDDETRHLVTLQKGFWLADTPCTQELWQEVMGKNPSYFVSPQRPVEQVSWEDTQEFFEALEERLPSFRARLPTEAEWEHACRAGRETATWKGDLEILGENNAPLLDSIGWYGGNSMQNFELEKGYNSSGWKELQYPGGNAGTHPVGQKTPNPWGLYDMLGNVFEWCEDWFGLIPSTPATDPGGAERGSGRVIRGGSWFSDARYVRAACRSGGGPGLRGFYLGFRLARGPGSGAE